MGHLFIKTQSEPAQGCPLPCRPHGLEVVKDLKEFLAPNIVPQSVSGWVAINYAFGYAFLSSKVMFAIRDLDGSEGRRRRDEIQALIQTEQEEKAQGLAMSPAAS